MSSPESISFALVVFDKASQVRPVGTFGSILRGEHPVVVDDNKKLLPTSFFESVINTEGDNFEQQASDQARIFGPFRSQGAAEQAETGLFFNHLSDTTYHRGEQRMESLKEQAAEE